MGLDVTQSFGLEGIGLPRLRLPCCTPGLCPFGEGIDALGDVQAMLVRFEASLAQRKGRVRPN
ncbi:hypothetical protein D9M68_511860 [compost metagenome]